MRRELELLGAQVVLRSDPELGLVAEGFDPEAEHAAEILTDEKHSLLPIFLLVVQRLHREGQLSVERLEKMVTSPKFPEDASRQAVSDWDPLGPAKLVLKAFYQPQGWESAAAHPSIPIELQEEVLHHGGLPLRRLAENSYAEERILRQLAHQFPATWYELARNRSTPADAIGLMAATAGDHVLRVIARRAEFVTATMQLLAVRGPAQVLEALSKRDDLEEEVVLQLAKRDSYRASTKMLRGGRDLSEPALQELTRSKHRAVAEAARKELYRRQQLRLAL